jgi:chitin disaccharide deacetylase
MKILGFVIISLLVLPGFSEAQSTAGKPTPVEVLIRCDDIGMCHSVDMAFKEVVATGLPVSASVMFACPWYREAVEILKASKNVSIGIHLTLNAEWANYRWGPVAGRSAVPSLVDSEGFFYPSRSALFGNNPKLEEIEHELRAQIERAVHSGLRIDYLDYHMGAAVQTLETRAVVEKLAREYKLGISRYFGEEDAGGWYSSPINGKKDTLLQRLRMAEPGTTKLFVFHIGLDTPEMSALIDLNSFGLSQMSLHREAELRALTSPEFRLLLKERNVRLKTYTDLVKGTGLETMRRPLEP